MERRRRLEPEGLARRIVDLMVGTLGEDVLMLDLRDVSTITDYFVIGTAGSTPQMRAIYRDVVSELGKEGIRPLRSEGSAESGWLLIDYGSVIVHIFSRQTRQYYDLEDFWKGARTVLRIM